MNAVIRVTGLYVYPIKSCGGLTLERTQLEARGPVYDRRWMIVDGHGTFVSQRELPRLALIQPSFAGDMLALTAPAMPPIAVPLQQQATARKLPVVVWRDACLGLDEGDAVADWFSAFLDAPVRLVRMADGFVRPVDRRYAREAAQVGFADAYPLLLIGQASLDDLNARLKARGKAALPMNRFRPNVVVAASPAYAEDDWRLIRVGEVLLDLVKPCARCVTTTVDQSRGEVTDKDEPLATLATYRRGANGVLFGQNAIHRSLGVLTVGDEVKLLAAAE